MTRGPRVKLVPEPLARYAVLDRVYEVQVDGVRIGEVGRDDVETDGARHLWHGWLDEFPGADEAGWDEAGWEEAVGHRRMTRAEAVEDVLDELSNVAQRLGVVLPWEAPTGGTR